MKNTILSLCMVAFVSCTYDLTESREDFLGLFKETNIELISQYYYWSGDKRVPLQIDSSKCHIIYRNDLSNYNLNENGVSNTYICNDHVDTICSIVSDKTFDIAEDKIIFKSYFFSDKNNNSIGISNNILVLLKDKKDTSILNKFIEKYNLEIASNSVYDPLRYTLKGHDNILEIANEMHESGLFEWACPDLLIQHTSYSIVNDSLYPQQWGLYNSQNQRFDINYEDVTRYYAFPFLKDVVVAVIDDGVDPMHEDLFVTEESFDIHSLSSPAQLSPGTHGTMVAGIIGAIANNGSGIAGVASGVKIMPISFRFKSDYDSNYTLTSSIAHGVEYAMYHGADIINCSFGATVELPINLTNIFNKAMDEGRDGKGCIVVFAAGNEDSLISNSYALSLPNALIVGGATETGVKSIYSAYGETLDLVAPGSGIVSTSIGDSYSISFGTSLAAPHVSGVAALMLGINPNMKRRELVMELANSAYKLPAYQYSSSGSRLSWNEKVGHGLLDAFQAVTVASMISSAPWDTVPKPEVIIPDTIIEIDTNARIINVIGETITSPKVYGGDVVICNQIMVYPTGVLILSADEKIVINHPFVVQAGGKFEFHNY